jgi:hypothetical protein
MSPDEEVPIQVQHIIAILQEYSAGVAPADMLLRHGISRQALYSGKRQLGNLQAPEAKWHKVLLEEHTRLKHLVADQVLNLRILKDVLVKEL